MRVGVCMCRVRVDVWEEVIWCMGVGVKADRMRIVIILVPRIYIYIYSLLIIFECVSY